MNEEKDGTISNKSIRLKLKKHFENIRYWAMMDMSDFIFYLRSSKKEAPADEKEISSVEKGLSSDEKEVLSDKKEMPSDSTSKIDEKKTGGCVTN